MLFDSQRAALEKRYEKERKRQKEGIYEDAPLRERRKDTSPTGRRDAHIRQQASQSLRRADKRRETTAQRIKQYANRVDMPMFGSDK